VADEHGYAVMGGAADVVAEHLEQNYTEGASLGDALRLAVAALGHSESDKGGAGDRVVPVDHLEVAVLDRTRIQPRKFSRLRPARLRELLGDRGPETPGEPSEEDDRPDAAPAPSASDDPADPTDQVSGSVPPLEDPTTGEPPVAPPPTDSS
jgi:proteasome alpha subunit